MRKNRKSLFLHEDIIRGRYLKQDAAGGGGATPGAEGGNGGAGGGNSSGGATGDSGDNNTGPEFDASTFWQGSDQSGSGSSESESASGDQSGSGTGANELRDELTNKLNTLQFGDSPMSQEIFEQAQEGNFEGFNKNLNAMLSQAVKQALGLSVSVLRPFAEQMMTEVENRISQRLGSRDDADQLVRDFPAAKDPKIRPAVEGLYQQALKNTKGDRPAAVEQVKSMMRLMSQSTAQDLGLHVAPRGADDSGVPSTPTNWLDELSARTT